MRTSVSTVSRRAAAARNGLLHTPSPPTAHDMGGHWHVSGAPPSGGTARAALNRPPAPVPNPTGQSSAAGTPAVGVPAIVTASSAAGAIARGLSGSAARFSWAISSRRST
jgi:hypothetical protein